MRLTARALGAMRLRAGVGALGALRLALAAVRSRGGLRLTARALGGFARLRAGWGALGTMRLALAGCGGAVVRSRCGVRHIRKGERAWEKLWGF